MKTKSKPYLIIAAILSLTLLVSQIILFNRIWRLSMLPNIFFVVLAVISFLICTALILMMILKFRKIKSRQIIALFLTIVIIILSFAGCFTIKKLNKTVENITHSKSSSSIGVYVLYDDTAKTIKDAKNYKFGITKSIDSYITSEALKLIEKEINKEPLIENHKSISEMIYALYSHKVKAILLSETQFNHLSEVEALSDFSKRARLIGSYTIEEKSDDKSNTNINVKSDTFIIYISGSDTRSKVLAKSRSDVNILAVVNPKTKNILLINTPRDYFVPNPALGNELDKLTHCGLYGVQCSIDALSALYGKPVLGYVQINFAGFEKLIDTIGGITVNSDVAFKTMHGDYDIKKGENHLNGNQALCFVRERYALAGGDNDRGKNQMKVISAIVDKLSASTIINNYSELLKSAEGMFSTNISNEFISKLVKMQLSDMTKWEVKSYAVTGRGGMDKPASMYGSKAYVMYPNLDSVEEAKRLIEGLY